jgi:hypothetical protein
VRVKEVAHLLLGQVLGAAQQQQQQQQSTSSATVSNRHQNGKLCISI